jgi:hypothetical protein
MDAFKPKLEGVKGTVLIYGTRGDLELNNTDMFYNQFINNEQTEVPPKSIGYFRSTDRGQTFDAFGYPSTESSD